MKDTTQKLVCYLTVAAGGYVMALKDIPADQIKTYGWWDWTLTVAGLVTAVAVTWRAFLDQSISRNGSATNTIAGANAPTPPKDKPV